jgi:hypothetical protein
VVGVFINLRRLRLSSVLMAPPSNSRPLQGGANLACTSATSCWCVSASKAPLWLAGWSQWGPCNHGHARLPFGGPMLIPCMQYNPREAWVMHF